MYTSVGGDFSSTFAIFSSQNVFLIIDAEYSTAPFPRQRKSEIFCELMEIFRVSISLREVDAALCGDNAMDECIYTLGATG